MSARIFFTDIISGPKTGGKDGNGVFLTIYGKGFGASQGASAVTVGGGAVADYVSWEEDASWSAGSPVKGMDMIVVQLGSAVSTGDVIVTVGGVASNAVTFTVRSGNIYFVDASSPADPGSGTYADPWRSPASYYDVMVPGDICYIREGVYSGVYGNGRDSGYDRWNLYIAKAGTAGNPIAFVGYPGEVAEFNADSGVNPTKNFLGHYNNNDGSDTPYIVIAKLRLIARGNSGGVRDGWRFVGNYVEGCHVAGGFAIVARIDNCKVLGNELTGGASGNKYDHAIYSHKGVDAEIGWNYIHDNDFGNGFMISCHTDNAEALGHVWDNHDIHDNIIDVIAYPSRAIGIAECAAGSSFYIYNNLIIGGATGGTTSIQIASSEVKLWNNHIYDIGGAAGSYTAPIHVVQPNLTYTAGPVSIVNNIIYTENSVYYIYVEPALAAQVTVDSNCYFGIGNYAGGDDANMVNADPAFVNAPYDLSLAVGSPCIATGSGSVSAVVLRDLDGLLRPQGVGWDIGAYEYALGVGNISPVISDVSATPDSGDPPLQVTFGVIASDPDGTIASYAWDFDDGDVSALQNPVHTYTSIGTYTAVVTVTDNEGATASDSVVVVVSVAANVPPVIGNVSATPATGYAPLTVAFSVTATDTDGTIVSYAWDFGDGGVSALQNPTHVYAAGGIYTVTVVVTDNDGATDSDSTSVEVFVAVPGNLPPEINSVAAVPNGGDAPLAVAFTLSATDADGTIASYAWDFGDGAVSAEQNPTHVFWTAGNYSVSVVVTDNDGATATGYVNVVISTTGALARRTNADSLHPSTKRINNILIRLNAKPLHPDDTITRTLVESLHPGNQVFED
jgi:PKD repeat protein